ncbi:hypothetical protein DFP72DRAFT_65365 [Ephemerocybe angulata]|uniref:DDE Tnp4 domain-containing protein n=1 Tax=Ephemerocybe angulata TaxID=980116 RepID=A0A8H6HFC0_9AGAR|nr:hypothetical protein DFP72DRAFT_65365 [Tulosesus angulatus]
MINRPEKAVGDNPTHNYHVSKVRVGSEHCVGFLKGRWSSLKGLRVAITNQKSLQYASFWIIACIHLHTFAMKHETVGSINSDKFYKDGKKYQRECRKRERRWRRARRRDVARNEEELDKGDDIALLEGKLKREELKEAMMVYLDQ